MQLKWLGALLFAAPLAAQKPDTVHIAPAQRQQLADVRAVIAEATKQQQLIVTTIVAGKLDPAALRGWSIQLGDSIIVLTPPAPPVADTVKKQAKP